jgi:uncharacterized protein YjiS (DUF1127 family)
MHLAHTDYSQMKRHFGCFFLYSALNNLYDAHAEKRKRKEMLKQIIDAIKYHYHYKQTLRELSKLSTRELEDIGIPRSMITRLSMEKAEEVVYAKTV